MNTRRIAACLSLTLLLSACAAQPPAAKPSAMPAATSSPNATQSALDARLSTLPPTLRVKAGERLTQIPAFTVDMPDGSAPTLTLKGLLDAQDKRRALIWFYQQDNTSL